MNKKKIVVAVSGGFDPIHKGHVRLFAEARKLGDRLVVILNNDNWLHSKKGYVFMPEKERVEIIRRIAGVDRVIVTGHRKNDSDRSVVKELTRLKPDVFANGGDRESLAHIPEAALCKKLGIRMVFGVGKGGKVQSSSWLTGKIAGKSTFDARPWGFEEVLKTNKTFWVKMLTISKGMRFSLQKHRHRKEVWVCVDGELYAEVGKTKKKMRVGDVIVVKKGETHRLGTKSGGTIVEIGSGSRVVEDDQIRLEDDFGRN